MGPFLIASPPVWDLGYCRPPSMGASVFFIRAATGLDDPMRGRTLPLGSIALRPCGGTTAAFLGMPPSLPFAV